MSDYVYWQDLIIPSFKNPQLIGRSPLFGFPALKRTILLSFQGNLGSERLPHYSRGIRQQLAHLAAAHKWEEQHNIVISGHAAHLTHYATLLSESIFCLVVPGTQIHASPAAAVASQSQTLPAVASGAIRIVPHEQGAACIFYHVKLYTCSL